MRQTKGNTWVRTAIHIKMILDIIRHGEARWVAADVGLALVLVHMHILHQYLRWKLHHGQFYGLPVLCCRSGHVSFGAAGMDR